MEIKLLSNEQEAAILNLIADKYQCKDNGASRMVFLVDTKDLIQIGLKLFENYKYVVKVSIGIAGINQSRIEASAFERFGATPFQIQLPPANVTSSEIAICALRLLRYTSGS